MYLTCKTELINHIFPLQVSLKQSKCNTGTFFGVERLERSELALCLDGAGLQGIW